MKHCSNADCSSRVETEIIPEFRDEISHCPYCHLPLQAGPAPDARRRESPFDAWVTVATFPDAHSAHLARAHLESIGVETVIVNEYTQYSTASEWVWLEVAPVHAQKSAEFLEDGQSKELGPLSKDELVWRWQRSLRWSYFFALWFALIYAVIGALIGATAFVIENTMLTELEPFASYEWIRSPFDGMGYTVSELRSQIKGTAASILSFMWIIAIIYLIAYLWAKRSPKVGFTIALLLFCGLELQGYRVNTSFDWFNGALFRLVPFFAFLGGIQRADQAPAEEMDDSAGSST